MIDPNAPAYPMPSGPEPRVDTFTHYNEGMTIRAEIAKTLMAAAISNPNITGRYKEIAHGACQAADALIAELNKEKP